MSEALYPYIDPSLLIKLDQTEREQELIKLFEQLSNNEFSRADTGTERWDRGWNENLNLLHSTGRIESSLKPKYFRNGVPIRFMGDFYMPKDLDFEYNWFCLLREYVAKSFLKDYKHIFEFGSGSGQNVAFLSQTFPDKNIMGLDWSDPAVEICETLRYHYGMNIVGRKFDLFNPDNSLVVPDGSALVTCCALEQTGSRWESFMEFVRQKKFAICVHIEPIVDFYQPKGNIVDYVAVKIHHSRNYLTGFFDYVNNLRNNGRAKIIESKRSILGSLTIEAYSLIVWRPL